MVHQCSGMFTNHWSTRLPHAPAPPFPSPKSQTFARLTNNLAKHIIIATKRHIHAIYGPPKTSAGACLSRGTFICCKRANLVCNGLLNRKTFGRGHWRFKIYCVKHTSFQSMATIILSGVRLSHTIGFFFVSLGQSLPVQGGGLVGCVLFKFMSLFFWGALDKLPVFGTNQMWKGKVWTLLNELNKYFLFFFYNQ